MYATNFQEDWIEIPTTGDNPTARHAHSTVIFENNMYLFGGWDTENNNEFYKLNLTTYHWSKLNITGEIPKPRFSHTAVVKHEMCFIFGGQDDDETRFDDLYMLNLNTLHCTKVKTQQSPPPRRSYHSAVVYKDSMIIFGGSFGGFPSFYNDVYEFQFATHQWRKLNTTGAIPSKRCNHKAVIWKDFMYVFGGYDGSYQNDMYRLNLKNGIWEKVQILGEIPSQRAAHSMIIHGDEIFIFGGNNGSTGFNEMYAFNCYSQRFRKINTSTKPTGRYFHAHDVYGDIMILHAGRNPDNLSDFYEFHLLTEPDELNLKQMVKRRCFGDVSIFCDDEEMF